jgi:hypothetical protein
MRIVNSVPPCRPSSRPKAVLYIVPSTGRFRFAIASERCYSRDGQFVVRRGGKLVPASSLSPVPDAVQMMGGAVYAGFNFVFRDLADFAASNSADPDAQPLGIESLKRPGAGPLALG